MTKEQIIAALFDGLRERGISQVEAARKLQHNHNTLSWWKTNRKTPEVAEMIRFADLAGMEIRLIAK